MRIMMEVMGWTGVLLLGEVLTLAYVAYVAFRWPLIFNYGFNIAVCVIILTACLFFRPGKKK